MSYFIYFYLSMTTRLGKAFFAATLMWTATLIGHILSEFRVKIDYVSGSPDFSNSLSSDAALLISVVFLIGTITIWYLHGKLVYAHLNRRLMERYAEPSMMPADD